MSVEADILRVTLPEEKKHKLQEGSNEQPRKKKRKKILKLPPSTTSVKVTITHEHRHSFVSNDNDDEENKKVIKESEQIISEARRIEQERKSQAAATAAEKPPAVADLQRLSETLALLNDPKQALTSVFEPETTTPNDNDEELEYGSEPLFDFSNFDETYERLNWHQNIVDNPNVQVKPETKKKAHHTLPMKTLILNNTVIKGYSIENRKLLVSLTDIERRSFDTIRCLVDPADVSEAKTMVRCEPSRLDPTDMDFVRRMQHAVQEESSCWARAHHDLDSSGNEARSTRSTLSVAEKTEMFVRCSDYRKEMFLPRTNSANATFSGQYGLFTILESPNLFLLPNSAVWCPEMQSRLGKSVEGNYAEFVDFERCRLNLLHSGPFVGDSAWMLWQSAADRPAVCCETNPDRHYVLRSRELQNTANAKFYCKPASQQDFAMSCECARNATVVLCAKKNHVHSTNQKTFPVAGDRVGSDNACLVAADTFGASTRERWISLLVVCAALPSARHSSLLSETFLKALDDDKHLCALSPCIREFGVDDVVLMRTGKPHDKKIVQRVGNRERTLNNISYHSHAHERFHLHDPVAMTLALLLFVDCQMTAGWFNVWRVWVAMLQTHARCCPFCSNTLSESLYRLVVYNAMLPVLPLTMCTMLEQLAATLRCNKNMYY